MEEDHGVSLRAWWHESSGCSLPQLSRKRNDSEEQCDARVRERREKGESRWERRPSGGMRLGFMEIRGRNARRLKGITVAGTLALPWNSIESRLLQSAILLRRSRVKFFLLTLFHRLSRKSFNLRQRETLERWSRNFGSSQILSVYFMMQVL